MIGIFEFCSCLNDIYLYNTSTDFGYSMHVPKEGWMKLLRLARQHGWKSVEVYPDTCVDGYDIEFDSESTATMDHSDAIEFADALERGLDRSSVTHNKSKMRVEVVTHQPSGNHEDLNGMVMTISNPAFTDRMDQIDPPCGARTFIVCELVDDRTGEVEIALSKASENFVRSVIQFCRCGELQISEYPPYDDRYPWDEN